MTPFPDFNPRGSLPLLLAEFAKERFRGTRFPKRLSA